MRMRTFLARARQTALNRESARACLASNLGMPGAGSLLAGRLSGVPQILIALAGLGITLVFGTRFIGWAILHWSQMRDPYADPLEMLTAILLAVRWPLAGIGLFALSWLWALVTSWSILNAVRRAETNRPVPPPLGETGQS